jgi:hypothetical protein
MSDQNPDEDTDNGEGLQEEGGSEVGTLDEEGVIGPTPQREESIPQSYERLANSMGDFIEHQRTFMERQEAQLRCLSDDINEMHLQQRQLTEHQLESDLQLKDMAERLVPQRTLKPARRGSEPRQPEGKAATFRPRVTDICQRLLPLAPGDIRPHPGPCTSTIYDKPLQQCVSQIGETNKR